MGFFYKSLFMSMFTSLFIGILSILNSYEVSYVDVAILFIVCHTYLTTRYE